ncbi:Predicted lipase/calmodulin-binding heat-shock protein [Phaffia rhodozyma]|uniref:sn-1-specific diacylglycerol lipase n=1 Tax=Phaffia rhodozyma TaxID=264483 RepID=A0A0F7SJH7_PHARH|nr:Predicted lipase/calmodulin-binding heat-shock protein [Phaffia rhodozyma]
MDAKDALHLSSSVAGSGIGLAVKGTRFGLGIARKVSSGFATVAGTVLDQTFSLGPPSENFMSGPTSTFFQAATTSSFDLIETLAIAPLLLTQKFTTSALSTAAEVAPYFFRSSSSSLDDRSLDQEGFSLAAFVRLVQRELNDPTQGLEGVTYSLTGVLTSISAWAGLQAVTAERWGDNRLLSGLRQIDVGREWEGVNQDVLKGECREGERAADDSSSILTPPPSSSPPPPPYECPTGQGQSVLQEEAGNQVKDIDDEKVKVTATEEITSSLLGGSFTSCVISAEVGTKRPPSSPSSQATSSTSTSSQKQEVSFRTNVIRFSRICLGSYGGSGLLFFGVPVPVKEGSVEADKKEKERQEEMAKEKEKAKNAGPGFWDTVWGKHDQIIFEHYAEIGAENEVSIEPTDVPASPSTAAASAELLSDQMTETESKVSGAVVQSVQGLPRFWILTDHRRQEVVLALRGTMSLNELAIDLTCDSSLFTPASSSTLVSPPRAYLVHSGMLTLARQMASPRGLLHQAVRKALEANEGYSLQICGHSLGAGAGAMLGMMWAGLDTGETVRDSELPVGRKVKVWAFACPCITSLELSQLSKGFITSIVLSYDLVSRLSLGSIRDIRSVVDWLSYATNDKGKGTESTGNEGVDGLLGRLARFKLGGKGNWIDKEGRQREEDWSAVTDIPDDSSTIVLGFYDRRATLYFQMDQHIFHNDPIVIHTIDPGDSPHISSFTI